jgi:hypothetical protein
LSRPYSCDRWLIQLDCNLASQGTSFYLDSTVTAVMLGLNLRFKAHEAVAGTALLLPGFQF